MNKAVAITIACFVALGAAGEIGYRAHRNSVRTEIRQAYAAVLTVEDYQGSDDFALTQADLGAREKLNALESRDLAPHDHAIVSCIAEFLGSMESLDSSRNIETTVLRTNIAETAASKASGCIKQLN